MFIIHDPLNSRFVMFYKTTPKEWQIKIYCDIMKQCFRSCLCFWFVTFCRWTGDPDWRSMLLPAAALIGPLASVNDIFLQKSNSTSRQINKRILRWDLISIFHCAELCGPLTYMNTKYNHFKIKILHTCQTTIKRIQYKPSSNPRFWNITLMQKCLNLAFTRL